MSKSMQVTWNATSDSLPKDAETVLIALEGGDVIEAAYCEPDALFMNAFEQEWECDEVLYWMSMPTHPSLL